MTILELLKKVAVKLSSKKLGDAEQEIIELGKRPKEIRDEENKQERRREEEREDKSTVVVKDEDKIDKKGDVSKVDEEAFEHFLSQLKEKVNSGEPVDIDEIIKNTEEAFYSEKEAGLFTRMASEIKYGSRIWKKEDVEGGLVYGSMVDSDGNYGMFQYPNDEHLKERLELLWNRGCRINCVLSATDEPSWFKTAGMLDVPFDDFWELGAVPGRKSQRFQSFLNWVTRKPPYFDSRIVDLSIDELKSHKIYDVLKQKYDEWRQKDGESVNEGLPIPTLPDVQTDVYTSSIVKEGYIKHCPGHKGSDGKLREWCIYSHETSKRLQCYPTKAEAEKGLQRMHIFKGGHFLVGKIKSGDVVELEDGERCRVIKVKADRLYLRGDKGLVTVGYDDVVAVKKSNDFL